MSIKKDGNQEVSVSHSKAMREMKKSFEKSTQGKKSRAKGQRFEIKVRQDLENLGWTVAKWTNTVDNEKHKVVPAKRKYNPFLKALSIGTGFPDFICFKRQEQGFDVIGLEVKGNGYLDQIEKGMCIWLLENKIFSRILIAKRAKEKGKIEYIDFNVKYNNK
jgi:hypothetical protein